MRRELLVHLLARHARGMLTPQRVDTRHARMERDALPRRRAILGVEVRLAVAEVPTHSLLVLEEPPAELTVTHALTLRDGAAVLKSPNARGSTIA